MNRNRNASDVTNKCEIIDKVVFAGNYLCVLFLHNSILYFTVFIFNLQEVFSIMFLQNKNCFSVSLKTNIQMIHVLWNLSSESPEEHKIKLHYLALLFAFINT